MQLPALSCSQFKVEAADVSAWVRIYPVQQVWRLMDVEIPMADRKQFVAESTANPILMELLEKAKGRVVTEEELREQRVSFAFGNAMNIAGVTKESVRDSSLHLRLIQR